MANLVSAPSITGTMYSPPAYTGIGVGLTDPLCLIGHADGLVLNEPYQVLDISAAITAMNSDVTSPLLKAMLEAYYAGARDIWLVASAPMSEYEPDLNNRATVHFYANYYNRLTATYSMLQFMDFPFILVPVEANFYNTGTADFLTQLKNHCTVYFQRSGYLRLGLIGTQGSFTPSDITAMATDPRLINLGEDGRQVSVMIGDGLYSIGEINAAGFTGPCVNALAGMLTTFPVNQSLVNQPIPNMINVNGNFTRSQITQLTEARLNPVIKTSIGRRGISYQSVLWTDNSLSPLGSDWWSLVQLRLCYKVINEVKMLGNKFMGTISYGLFKSSVNDYFKALAATGILRDYRLDIFRPPADQTTINVNVVMMPYFGLRQIALNISAGFNR